MPVKDEPKTASKSERQAAFHFEDIVVRGGTKRTVDVPIARIPSGTLESLPVAVVHGRRPGPTICLSGAIHGDELNGIAIVRKLLLTLDPKQISGTVLAVPIVNVFGVISGSRYLPDRRDLNRSFPGSVRGSLAARLSHLFFEKIVSRCRVGIDFHTGSGGRSNLPQIRGDIEDAEILRLAEAFHPPLVLHAGLRKGSLRDEAAKRDIRIMVFEAGEALRFSSAGVKLGVEGTLRVMRALGMIDEAPEVNRRPMTVTHRSRWVRASRSGFCRVLVDLGDTVKAGDRLAATSDSIGKKEVVTRSPVDGLVLGILRTAIVHRGDAVVHIAEFE